MLSVKLKAFYTFLTASRFDGGKFVAENRNEYFAVEVGIVDYKHVCLFMGRGSDHIFIGYDLILFLFRLIHQQGVGSVDRFVYGLIVRHYSADTQRQRNSRKTFKLYCGYVFADTVEYIEQLAAFGPGKYCDKFVAAVSYKAIVRADTSAYAASDGAQYIVACGVTVNIVIQLEVVDIYKGNACVHGRILESFFIESAVVAARKHVDIYFLIVIVKPGNRRIAAGIFVYELVVKLAYHFYNARLAIDLCVF